jgi:DNA (cytosine-5)-methyltransferase 1
MDQRKKNSNTPALTFIDLFCGIGGFRIAAKQVSKSQKTEMVCVFSSDIDKDAQDVYESNFGERPAGDITKITASEIPDHDLLFGGFPCQAFSIIGSMKGFEDARGTLFFDIARILHEKQPKAFVLENVKQLRGHDSGRTLETIRRSLDDLGYWHDFRVLNALDFGLPQKRERIIIVGFRKDLGLGPSFTWPTPSLVTPSLEDILEDESEVDPSFRISSHIKAQRQEQVKGKLKPKGRSVWHENKSGNISMLPYACALRAGASYNYLLVDGKRRLTGREMLRLQGFPDTFKMARNYTITRKQAGNSVPVPMIQSVISQVVKTLNSNH